MFLRKLYSCWVIAAMAIFFVLFILPLTLCALLPRLHQLALWMNHLWAVGFFRLAFIPIKATWQFKPRRHQQYILCANHFSYLDIPALGLFPRPFKFVGKSQLSKIPLFGIMYNRIHVTVNRGNYKSRASSLVKARNEMSKGYNMGFFPEGGIVLNEFPKLESFKDGAFRLAVETQTPIIPITFLDNYRILPDDEILRMRRLPCRIIYHEPVYPKSNSEDAAKQLKHEVFRVIQTTLDNETHGL